MSGKKLLVVFGATGQQGGSVVEQVVHDPELSNEYQLRAVTRDPSKPAAQALAQKGAEVVKADLDDPGSIKHALNGAHTVFATTNSIYQPGGKEKEFQQGKVLADAAVSAGVQYLIWSTSTHVERTTGGKLKQVVYFDVKVEVEDYIRGLPIKSAFFAPGAFMQVFNSLLRPYPEADGTFTIRSILKLSTELPLFDAASDTGKFVGAILANPQKYEGKTLSAATRLYPLDEIIQILSKVTRKTINYAELFEDEMRELLPAHSRDIYVEMLAYQRDYGYFGPKQQELVEWSIKQSRGELTTLEEYLAKNPLLL